jgi:competence protein ComEA
MTMNVRRHGATHERASPFSNPLVRVGLGTAGLLVLAIIGHAASARLPAQAPAVPVVSPSPGGSSSAAAPLAALPTSSVGLQQAAYVPRTDPPTPSTFKSDDAAPRSSARSPPTPEDPVILNAAGVDDLRRLPGIGEKRAVAIVSLRERLGRLHALEDLLKVRGIGRATLRRLRPLMRLDAAPRNADAGPANSTPRLN